MNAPKLPTPQIVILAAGVSSRLGQPKALVRVRGSTLLRRTLLVASRCSPGRIIVVVPPRVPRYQIEARGLGAVFAANPRRTSGLSSSVRHGIRQARFAAAILLLPVDLALLRDRDLARLVHRWRGARRRLVARRIGRHGGIPLILPRWLFGSALSITGDAGLRDLVSGLPQQRLLLDLPSAAHDVDTPRDLRAARRSARSASITP